MVKGNATGLGDLVLGAVGSAERLRPGVGGFEKGERAFCDAPTSCFGWIACREGCWCCNGGSMCCWEVSDSGMGSNGRFQACSP